MTDDENRAERAARDYFAGESGRAEFTPLDPAAIRRLARGRVRWIGGALAAAACLLVAVVAVPLALRGGVPSHPVTAAPAAPRFEWSETAPPPLAARFGSLTGWLDGQFYIIGGWVGGGPCPPGAMCDMKAADGTDGARYDPLTDTWTRIADAPAGIDGDTAQAVVADGKLYTWAGGEVLSYDPGADRWTYLPNPASSGDLVSAGPALVLGIREGTPAGYSFEPDGNLWTPLSEGPLDTCTDRRSLSADTRILVVATCGDRFTLAFYDPAAGTWSDTQVPEGAIAGLRPVYLAGKLVWPDQLSMFSSTRLPGLYDTRAGEWTTAEAYAAFGGLSYRGMMGSVPHLLLPGAGLAAAANGSLLDVRTGGWVEVPDAPVPDRWEPVVVGGSTSLLSCFGYVYGSDSYDSGSYHEGCFLGSVSRSGTTPPAEPTPTVAPTTTPSTPASQQTPTAEPSTALSWVEIQPPLSWRSGPLMVEHKGGYYVIGGTPVDTGDERTGARYDPATDDWAPIADLPADAGPDSELAGGHVTGDLVYLVSRRGEQALLIAYDHAQDSWERIGPVADGEQFVGTEDGLFRFRMSAESGAGPWLLTDQGWKESGSPLAPGTDARAFRLDDHHIGLVSGMAVATFDTSTLEWDYSHWSDTEPSHAAERVFGAGGSVVLVRMLPDEGQPGGAPVGDVYTYRDGQWLKHDLPATAGGLGSFTGPAWGRWAVIAGNLFDPATGEWVQVPPFDDDLQWTLENVAIGPAGALGCFPYAPADKDNADPTYGGCWFLPPPR